MSENGFITNVERELIPISALSQYVYCPRRCALIFIEQIWNENLFTAEGRIIHERVHEENRESRGDVRIEYGVSLRSLRLGLIGKADVIEFHRQLDSTWLPFPVEYKRGKPKPDSCDAVQLCAQALCLEEMLGVEVTCGALYYGKTHRRHEVVFDEKLRRETEETARRVHELIASGETPRPVYKAKCDNCSLFQLCLPKTIGKKGSVKRYLSAMVRENEKTS
ncbi:MAG: CRISPR-associated protein Cas4 [Thermodesulfobacteriota bacterium]